MFNHLPVPAPAGDPVPAHLRDLFDPCDLGPIDRVPLIPEAVRRRRHVFVPADHRFKAAARFLQALWREDRGLDIGHHANSSNKRRRLGSRISIPAGHQGANFIHPDILPVVGRALAYREPGAAYDVDRLKTNLLSSQPLTFNLFGLLARDTALATRFMAEFIPGLMREVTDITFEHSPGRGEARFTQDGTAFDVAVRGRSATGERLFVGIEVKFSESTFETVPRFSPRYAAIAPTTDLFVDPAATTLRTNPCQQLFRQHCVAATILEHGLTDRAVLVFIAPQHNTLAATAARAYANQLRDPAGGPIPFIPRTLEQAITALAATGLTDHARALHRRYCDWWLVDSELELAAMPAPPPVPAVTPAAADAPKGPTLPVRRRQPHASRRVVEGVARAA
ncbi:PGN_0703 family putative restriction endonuclease [Methylorubrum thiocyanatum]|uniref:PGN_0703 family putative restriction endonuclease n=1 Tax=Methylorubrum thiocyanatum TaxID=47958 RepID=UPI00365B6534